MTGETSAAIVSAREVSFMEGALISFVKLTVASCLGLIAGCFWIVGALFHSIAELLAAPAVKLSAGIVQDRWLKWLDDKFLEDDIDPLHPR